LLPCGDFADEALGVVDSTVQALAAQHADLDLDHVEPTGMLGGVVELEAAQNIEAPAEWVDKLSCPTRMHAASG
jgi:hypothetical protein